MHDQCHCLDGKICSSTDEFLWVEWVPPYKRGTQQACSSPYGLTNTLLVPRKCAQQIVNDNTGHAWIVPEPML